MTLRSIASAASLLLSAVAGAPAMADPAPLHLSLAYDGRLYIKVLDLHFDETVGATTYAASVSMRSYGILAAFKHFDLQANTQGRLDGGPVRPTAFSYINHDGKRVREVATHWDDADVRMTSTPPFSNLGEPPATPAQKAAAADPLTHLVRILVTPPHDSPCDHGAAYFDGKQLYALDLVPAAGAELNDHARALGLVNPTRCVVRYREIAGFKRKPANKRGQGLGDISVTLGQLGQNGPWLIALLESDTPLGHAHIELREVRATGARP